MLPMPNSAAARDIAYYVHPQTSLRRHQESGPVVIDRGEGAIVYDVKPDMVTCAKALSVAYQPISAVLINEKMHQAMLAESDKLGSFAHGYTHSGHPVATAVALE